MLGVHCEKEVATRRGCLNSFKHQHVTCMFPCLEGEVPSRSHLVGLSDGPRVTRRMDKLKSL